MCVVIVMMGGLHKPPKRDEPVFCNCVCQNQFHCVALSTLIRPMSIVSVLRADLHFVCQKIYCVCVWWWFLPHTPPPLSSLEVAVYVSVAVL